MNKSNNKTTKLQQLRKKLITAVHLSKRYKNYYIDDKDSYKKLLLDNFGVDSSKKLSINQLISLLDYLNFKTPNIETKETQKASQAQINKIKELWSQYAKDTSDRALIHFLSRYNNNILVLKLENFPAKVLQKGIIAIKKTISKGSNNGR